MSIIRDHDGRGKVMKGTELQLASLQGLGTTSELELCQWWSSLDCPWLGCAFLRFSIAEHGCCSLVKAPQELLHRSFVA